MEKKAPILRFVLVALFGIFILRIFFLQVVFGNQYRVMAERNRFQIFYRQAPRGLILDSKGFPLASNASSFNLYFNPHVIFGDLADHTRRVADVLMMEPEELKKAVDVAKKRGKTTLIVQQLKREKALRFFEMSRQFPEFFLDAESVRHYPLGNMFSHILGYLTRIQSRDEFKNLAIRGYRFDSWIGRYGLERVFEDQLRGEDGAVLLEVDALGRPNMGNSDRPGSLTYDSSPGKDVVLTVRAPLLKVAYDALKATKSGVGSVVAIDPLTGAILALVITPSFDPNEYVRLDAPKTSRAEFPRALVGTYPPGSVFKIVSGTAILEAGMDPQRRFHCNGKYALPTRVFKCWKPEGHGSVDFVEGLKHSCDVYYYNAGLFAGGDKISSQALNFGLGQSIAIDEFPQWNSSGFVPTPAWKERKKGDIWRPGDTLNLSIGQGELLTSPLQLAALITMVANRGTLYKPFLVSEVRDPSGSVLFRRDMRPEHAVLRRVENISSKTWDLIEESLHQVVESGTARGMHIKGVKIYGKTGTAQNPHGDDHSLFVAYVKDANGTPRLSVAVVVENGGHGSTVAVPVARKVVEEFLKDETDIIVAN